MKNAQLPWRLVIILGLVFVIVPGRAGWLDGLPLGQLHELIVITILGSLLFFPPPAGRPQKKKTGAKQPVWLLLAILLLLIILKPVLGALSLERGLNASYYSSAESQSGNLELTRVDRVINFKNNFPLWFFNDFVRFKDSEIKNNADRPWSAVWEGYLYKPADQSSIRLDAKGQAVIWSGQNSFPAPAILPLTKEQAVTPIKMVYTPSRKEGEVALTWGYDGNGSPIKTLFPKRYSLAQIKLDGWIGLADSIVKINALLIVLAALLIIFSQAQIKKWLLSWRPYAWVMFIIIFGILTSRALAAAQMNNFNLLTPGNDPFAYETFARHIQSTGDWAMKDPAMQQVPYYYSLFYYFLAIIHLIVGEVIFPAAFMQIIFISIISLLIFQIGRLFLKPADHIKNSWPLLLLVPAVGLYPPILSQSLDLYPDFIAAFFITLSVFLLLWARERGWVPVVFAGAALGLAALNKFNFLTWFPLAVLWLIFVFRKQLFRLLIYVFSFIAGFGVVLFPFILRNYLLMGEWQLFSRGILTANFVSGNPLPENYIPPAMSEGLKRFFDKFVTGPEAFSTIQWILDRPLSYIQLLGKKLLPVIGLSGGEINYWLLIPFILLVLGSIIFLTKPSLVSASAKERVNYWLVGGFVLAQIITVTIFASYENRYYMPTYPFVLLFALFALMGTIKITRLVLRGPKRSA